MVSELCKALSGLHSLVPAKYLIDKWFQTLAEILSEREMICHLMENILDDATRPWGVKVERVEIKVSRQFSTNKWEDFDGTVFIGRFIFMQSISLGLL